MGVEGEEVEVNEVEEEMKVEDTGGEEVEVEGEEVVEVGTTEEKGAEVGRAAGGSTDEGLYIDAQPNPSSQFTQLRCRCGRK